MPRANGQVTKVYLRGKSDDFIVIVDDTQAVQKWRQDRTIPLQHVLSGWKVFVTHRHGAQGVFDNASKASLENEFGTSKDEECIRQILERGEIQETSNKERQGDKNSSRGSSLLH